MPGHVEHRPAPRVARDVGDPYAGEGPGDTAYGAGGEGVRRQQLAQGLDSAQQAGGVGRVQEYGVGGDGQHVPLRAEGGERRIESEGDLSVSGRGQGQPGGGGVEFAQQYGGRLGAACHREAGALVESELPRQHHELAGHGKQRYVDCGHDRGAFRDRINLTNWSTDLLRDMKVA